MDGGAGCTVRGGGMETCWRWPAACRYSEQHISGIDMGASIKRSPNAAVVLRARSWYLNCRKAWSEEMDCCCDIICSHHQFFQISSSLTKENFYIWHQKCCELLRLQVLLEVNETLIQYIVHRMQHHTMMNAQNDASMERLS